MNIGSLEECLINGNPRMLTYLTLHKVHLFNGNVTLSLDAFHCLVHLEMEKCLAWIALSILFTNLI